MNNKSLLIKIPVWLNITSIFAFAVFPYLLIYYMSADTIVNYFGEDKFFEWFSAFSWILAAVLFGLSLRAVISRPGVVHPIWYFGLVAITFIAAGEEISWGQRLFDYETPAVVANSNLQGEMNLHNLELFDVRTSVDGDHKTGIQRWLTFGRMGSLIWIGFLIILPLSTKFIPPLARFFAWTRMPVPPVQLAYLGIVGYVSCLIVDTLNGPVLAGDENQYIKFAIKFAINEYKETLVAALFMCAAMYSFVGERRAAAESMT